MRHIFRILVLLVVFIGLLGAKRPLAAAGVVGSGTPGSCTEAALNNALSGGGTVTFNCGANPHTITVTSEKSIVAHTTIDGGGLITISGGNSTRVFHVQNNNNNSGYDVVLRNLTVANGRSSGNGGGVSVERLSSLTIENSTFSGNVGHNGGAVATDGWGANDPGVAVTITGSTFTNNTATATAIPGGGNGGGGLYLSGGSAATITDSTFTGNQSQNGGAIHLLHSNLLATNVTFNSNVANNSVGGGGGGAIYMDGTKSMAGEVRIVDSRFNSNSTNQLGGAMFTYPEGVGTVTISTSTFDGNVSNTRGQGGAIYHQAENDVQPMTIEESLFVNNRAVSNSGSRAGQGGAIWSTEATLVINNSTFTQNDASNSVNLPGDDWHRGFGGAIRTNQNTTILNSTIVNNTAGFVGGGLAGSANVKNTILANNTGGNEWDIQQNCTDEVTNQGGNIQYPQKTTGNWNDYECFGSQQAENPQLMSLDDYGGPTLTMAFPVSSPARNGGVNNGCAGTDQRGFSRDDGQCDSGAFEMYAAPAPVLVSLAPPWAGTNESGSSKTLTVFGADFTNDNVVRWDGSNLTTSYVSPYQLTAIIPGANLASIGTVDITVYDPSETATSDALTFTIVDELTWVYLPTILR